MRSKGKIAAWNDEKGYGFISPMTGGARTFIHIKAFANRARRPSVGDIVTYSVTADSKGRPIAAGAALAGVRDRARPGRQGGKPAQLFALTFLLLVTLAAVAAAVPPQVLGLYLGASLATYAAYARDKMAAERSGRRIPENNLHVLGLVGGWPGALLAQGRLRHKTRKQPFRAVFWATVVLNCTALAWLLTPGGQGAWQSLISLLA